MAGSVTSRPTIGIARAVWWVVSCGGVAWVSRTSSAVLPVEIRALPVGRVTHGDPEVFPEHVEGRTEEALQGAQGREGGS